MRHIDSHRTAGTRSGRQSTGLSTERPEITGGGLDTWTLTDAVLFGAVLGSRVVEAAVAELTISVLLGVGQTTVTVRLNCAEAPAASEEAVQFTCPAPPAAGLAQDHPAGADSDLNTVPAGIASVSDTLSAGRSSSVGRKGS